MAEQDVLKYLMEIFPAVGSVEGKPLIEMKYKMQFGGSDDKMTELQDVIDKLKEKGVLNEFEFNNTINYKAKKDIPIALAGAGAGGDDLSALKELVLALAAQHDDPKIKELAQN